MKKIQFFLSVLVAVCAAGMFIGALTTPGPLKDVSLTLTGIILAGSIWLVCLVHKEMRS